MKGLSLFFLCLLLLSCSRPFDQIPKSQSKALPKQILISKLVDPSTFVGQLARQVEKSSPIVVGDKLYVGSVHGYFLALRRETGRLLGKKSIQGGVESTPSYFDGKIY